MKKTIITIAIILGISVAAFADGGLFQRRYNAENGKSGYVYFGSQVSLFENGETPQPLLPAHSLEDNQSAPLGGGIAVLMGLGAAYLVAKRREQE